jgi:hypothetical protein
MTTELYVNAWVTLAQTLSADDLVARIRSDIARHTSAPVPTPAVWANDVDTLRLALPTRDQREAFALALRRDEVALGHSQPDDDETRRLAAKLADLDQRIDQQRADNRERAAFAAEVRALQVQVAELTRRLASAEEDVHSSRHELARLVCAGSCLSRK